MSETLNEYRTIPSLYPNYNDRSTIILSELRKMNGHLIERINEMNDRLKALEDWIMLNKSDGK